MKGIRAQCAKYVAGVALSGGAVWATRKNAGQRQRLKSRIAELSATVEQQEKALARAEAEQLRLAAEVEAGQQRWRLITNTSPDIIAILDARGVFQFVSPAIEHVLGYERDELVGSTAFDLICEEDRPYVLHRFAEQMTDPLPDDIHRTGVSFRACRKDGQLLPMEARGRRMGGDARNPVGMVMVVRDMSEHTELVARLETQALHDDLTGLPNRSLFLDRVDQALARQERSEEGMAVMFLDLDHFKDVNDRLGHRAGDQLLVEVGRRLTACLRDSDTAARLGGDEFTILLESLEDEAQARMVGRRILATASEPAVIDGVRLQVSASIGLVMVARPDPALTPDELLRRADIALYAAKGSGRSRIALYDASMDMRIPVAS